MKSSGALAEIREMEAAEQAGRPVPIYQVTGFHPTNTKPVKNPPGVTV